MIQVEKIIEKSGFKFKVEVREKGYVYKNKSKPAVFKVTCLNTNEFGHSEAHFTHENENFNESIELRKYRFPKLFKEVGIPNPELYLKPEGDDKEWLLNQFYVDKDKILVTYQRHWDDSAGIMFWVVKDGPKEILKSLGFEYHVPGDDDETQPWRGWTIREDQNPEHKEVEFRDLYDILNTKNVTTDNKGLYIKHR